MDIFWYMKNYSLSSGQLPVGGLSGSHTYIKLGYWHRMVGNIFIVNSG